MSQAQKNAMIAALETTLGVVTQACEIIGITRQAHYKWMREDEEYKKRVEEVENVAIDFAESELHKQIKSGNSTSTIFFLKTKAKKRGYVEQMEVDSNININQVELNSKLNESLNSLAQKLIDE